MITVRAAERDHRSATRELHQLEERARTDMTVTPGQLVEARAAVDLAAGRVDGARRAVERAEQARRDELAAVGERRRQKRAEVARAERLAGEQRAIESGAAEIHLHNVERTPETMRMLAAIEAWRESGAETWPGYDAVEVPA